jgi:hypothetical protein
MAVSVLDVKWCFEVRLFFDLDSLLVTPLSTLLLLRELGPADEFLAFFLDLTSGTYAPGAKSESESTSIRIPHPLAMTDRIIQSMYRPMGAGIEIDVPMREAVYQTRCGVGQFQHIDVWYTRFWWTFSRLSEF